MRICPQCNRKNLDKAKVCEKCGASLIMSKKGTKSSVSARKVVSAVKNRNQQEVVITDIKIPFWSMVMFMVKWVFASIPAIIIVALLILLSVSVASGLGNFFKILLQYVRQFL
ncbi:zinc-ribbon domain-containing protein [Desulfonema magnum]|uniref:Zinc ribbon domain-containing protein n=1 Tax=Desulfonema magnum TaxID=45655 RepID=A0A975GQK3_9BACT|nr:zinc-ribbon domain-containing protein [Desulfonema magnum]QTA89984.1 Zinc ribbon domain-containing protein [Desulfonema magnum]